MTSIKKRKKTGEKKTWVNTKIVSVWNGKEYTTVLRRGYWYDGPLALATTPPTLEVTNWAFYNDGTESGAIIIGSVNTNPTLDVDTLYHVRFGIEETSGNTGKNVQAQLEYNHNGGGWNDVNAASSVVQTLASASLTDDNDTTQRITAYTFDSTNEGVDNANGLAGGGTADLNTNGMEVLFPFQILSADVANNDTIQLRIVDLTGTVFDVYNQTDPSITVNEAAPEIPLAGLIEAYSITSNPPIFKYATLAIERSLTATEAVTTTATGDLTVLGPAVVPLEGAEAATTTTAGDLTVTGATREVAGTIASVTTATGDITITFPERVLQGTSAAASAASGALGIERPLASQSDTAATITGDITILGAVKVDGLIAAITTVAGTIAVDRTMTSQSATVATVTGSMTSERPIAGSIAAVTTAAGDLIIAPSQFFDGTIDVLTTTAGAIKITRGLDGTISASTVIEADPTMQLGMAAVADAVLSAVGALGLDMPISGTITAQLTINGALATGILDIEIGKDRRVFIMDDKQRVFVIDDKKRVFQL